MKNLLNMKQVILQKFISRQNLKDNPDTLYIFGDNDSRVGSGGQAREMRGEPNAVGIRTKKAPKTNAIVYYNDNELFENIIKISEDFIKVYEHLLDGKIVIIPSDGIGTGLAKLEENAPNTLKYIDNIITVLIEKFNAKERGLYGTPVLRTQRRREII